ncbi:MAG: CAP domain-containing protein [Candidatus Nitrosopolaris sp.]
MVQEKIIRSMIAPVVVAGILILAVLTAIPSNALMTHSSSEYEKCVKSTNNCFLLNNESSNAGNGATSQESNNAGTAQHEENSNTGTAQHEENSNTGTAQHEENSNTGTAQQVSVDDKTILDIHNRERADVKVPALVWSDKLAADAKPWAEHLVKLNEGKPIDKLTQNDLVHATGTGQGENLSFRSAWGSGPVSPPSTESLVQGRYSWVEEKSWTPMGGHYTQMVWKNTKEIGCATATSNGKTSGGQSGLTVYLVCRYSPPGNTGGPPY